MIFIFLISKFDNWMTQEKNRYYEKTILRSVKIHYQQKH
jgi:hypothetical protein